MSTFIKSAAMTLLSKTLQTLLYKYLSDVDVEGVNLPSLLSGGSDGHSGWGVRLANVHLREGAKLLDLPGPGPPSKKKKKKKPKKKKVSNSKKHKKSKKEKANHRKKKHQQQRINKEEQVGSIHGNSGSATAATTNTTKSLQRSDSNSTCAATAATGTTATTAATSSIATASAAPVVVAESDTETIATQSTSNTTATTTTKTAATTNATSQAATAPAAETTSTSSYYSSSSSWFYWYSSTPAPPPQPLNDSMEESKRTNQDPPPASATTTAIGEEKQQAFSNDASTSTHTTSTFVAAASLIVEEDDEVNDDDDNINDNNESDSRERQSSSSHSSYYFCSSPPPKNRKQQQQPEVLGPNEEEYDSTHAEEEDDEEESDDSENDTDDDDDDDEEEDDDEEQQQQQHPMILQIGKGSRIAVLDIRLIGKNIHVYVEDALLCVEAVRVVPPTNSATTTTSDGATTGATSSSTADSNAAATATTGTSSSSSNADGDGGGGAGAYNKNDMNEKQDATAKPNVTPAVPEPEPPATTAERVLAENAIAKALSAIPNLFLRDILIQFVLRHDDVNDNDNNVAPPSTEAADKNDPSSTNDNVSPAAKQDSCSVVEISIELLSVTDGEDFLAKFRTAGGGGGGSENSAAAASMDDEDERTVDHHSRQSSTGVGPSSQKPDYEDPNEYLVKRIRTGRGPEGGVCIRVYPPGQHDYLPRQQQHQYVPSAIPSTSSAYAAAAEDSSSHSHYSTTNSMIRPLWSRHSWQSMTHFCLLRCSGLDVRARIFLGRQDEDEEEEDDYDSEDEEGDYYHDKSNSSWFGGGKTTTASTIELAATHSEEYDEYDVDSMLFGGVDYIAPGPQPPLPLPPMRETADALSTGEEEKFWTHEGATVYRTDKNGIQSSAVSSCFHRVGRGLTPTVCNNNHEHTLPCENCVHCWKVLPWVGASARTHALDGMTPMGGLVLSILTRDPLEINADRSSLVVLGDVLRLFSKNPNPSSSHRDANADINVAADGNTCNQVRGTDNTGGISRTSEYQQGDRGRGSYESRNSFGSKRSSVGCFVGERFEDLSSSFPSYMQPEKIQILGMHFSDLILRIHVMRDDGVRDDSLSYCFWDVAAKCVTMDYQTLARVPEKSLQDFRFDIGYLTMKEFKGSECKLLMSLGLRQRMVEFDDLTIETMKTREALSNRSPWPSTAAALLEVQPPLETLVYEERDRHAFQFRYIVVEVPVIDPDRRWTHVNVRFGPSSVDAPFTLKDQIPVVISAARACVFGPPSPVAAATTAAATEQGGNDVSPSPAIKAIMKYKVQMDGGRIKLYPRLEMKMPLTVFVGERSAELGLSFQTVLDRFNFSFGEGSVEPRALECGLSLQQLAELPEKVRLRILLFLSDLGPLERALCVKAESNSFLRCRAVNKGIMRVAKRAARGMVGRGGRGSMSKSLLKGPNRRQELLNELLRLDDDALEDLLMVHRRYQRKGSQRS